MGAGSMSIKIILTILKTAYWLQYIPIIISIIISCYMFFKTVISKYKNKRISINCDNFIVVLLCQIFHYVVINKFDLYFPLSIVLLSLNIIFYQIFNKISNKKIELIIDIFSIFLTFLSFNNCIFYVIPCLCVMLIPITKKLLKAIIETIFKK